MKRCYETLKVGFLVVMLLLGSVGYSYAQQKSVRGNITTAAGEQLAGVTLYVKGMTSVGTISGENGDYSINLPDGAEVLVFSFVGMITQEISIGNQGIINVQLVDKAIDLEELVVVGYGIQTKKTLTGSISSVQSADLTQRPAANTTELLMGKVSGLVTMQESGLPGADGAILQIRGFGSPLILIDGVQGSLADIDPNDIESISTLKDASASVYGARAGNGVILVTTKRGSKTGATINYSGTYSFTQPTFLPDRVGAGKWAELLHESGLNPDEYSPKHVVYNPDDNSLMDTLSGTPYAGYDWSEGLYRNWTPQLQHNISARGGSDAIQYFISVGMTDQESNFKSGDYDYTRYNVRSNIDAKITDNLSASMDFSYRQSIMDRANFSASTMYNSLQTAKPVYPFIHDDPERAAYSGFLQRSPYAQTFKDFSGWYNNNTNSLLGAFELKYSFPTIEGLTASARLSYEEIFVNRKNVSKPFNVWEYDPTAMPDGDPWIAQGTQNGNTMYVYTSRATELMPVFSLQYAKRIGDHNFKGVLVSETRTYNFTSLRGDRKDLLSFQAPYLSYASEEGKDNNEGTSQTARSSVIGRVNYDFKGKYLLEFAMRADASAEYPTEGRWGFFPSISAGWRLSDEDFIKDNFDAVNNLKLRGSFGVLGNDAVSSFDYLTGYNITSNFYLFGSTPYPIISSAGLANPNVTWESMKLGNIGIEGILWDGLFGFEIDAFYRLRENILTTPTETVPTTFGADLPRTNLNKRDNRGFEVLLSHRNRVGEFAYDISPMFSWSRGKYVDLQEEISEDPEWNARYIQEGGWDDLRWGLTSDGFFMNQAQIDEHIVDQDQNGNTTIKVGDLIYNDINNDSIIDWHDEQVIGTNSLPNIMYSMNVGAEYRGFRLSMLWQGAADYTVVFSGSAAAPFSNESIPLIEHYNNRAIIGVDEEGNEYITNPDDFSLPNVTQNGRTQNNGKASDFWSYNAKFLRLKNMNISYSLPRSFVSRIGVTNCVVYLSGTNLLTFSNLGIWKNSFDPEIRGQNGRDYPPVKTVSFGLRLTI
ncbi:MAG: TonB-dependent receptor [Bacteroidetes bacterium]|nr:TonB-dependent receptor [Bacteroidota bacterium]